ncbi:hypothetical protein DPMN_000182 [Dreissena polymorpha]|uniref:Uncharacterized protein n=1 Tax=Dreissena polymorpha TaxID=45954 RepID=A0A9D4MJ94_DREPO|nr:hypothetical protein DPMN_000182 [Dreissena polymorpha]
MFFQPIWTIFELVRDINKTNVLTKFMMLGQKNETNVLTKFHEDLTKNMTSRGYLQLVFRQARPTNWTKNMTSRKTALPPGGHVFEPIWSISKLVRDINKPIKITKTSPSTGGHVFQRTGTTFELNQHIIKTNILTQLHEDLA